MASLAIGADGLARCSWAVGELYEEYHDKEWGQPVHGDDKLFERMALEGFQSGLSWITILRKRPAFRAGFAGFTIEKVAAFGDKDVERLMADAGIVRNRAKIEATISNARVAATLELDELLWSFAPQKRKRSSGDIPATTAESVSMSKALKKKGFRFVGPTTCYALMQATGMVDDHLKGCYVL
jgi:DNA-3-methyladenine glycosylase I